MPNIKSAKKRVLIGEVRNARNKATKSDLKTAIKKFEAAAAEGNRTEAEGALDALGELTGRTAREDMVTRIFERFCVGK